VACDYEFLLSGNDCKWRWTMGVLRMEYAGLEGELPYLPSPEELRIERAFQIVTVVKRTIEADMYSLYFFSFFFFF
jgi:hypothetical protein